MGTSPLAATFTLNTAMSTVIRQSALSSSFYRTPSRLLLLALTSFVSCHAFNTGYIIRVLVHILLFPQDTVALT